ncbi:hypothetical protein PV327_000945 [Microctonus hyperodae]|uniref:RRM domain-containing protein n=1 Tax=Microctonus hyperodae TaxID=165561 RepID=A0AA39G7M8_MICHY|nr:hypothetical protein PV327_000945 [Microctonus hyperodae]
MASRKKGKKTKGQTIALTEFLAPGGVPTVPLKSTSWADDYEEDHDIGCMPSRSSKEPVVLPTAPRAARGPGVDEENIPTNPPYVAYISNLPYDVVEDDLAEFFADMDVSNMRLPRESNKFKGYGYIEFVDRQSLIDALSLTNTMIKTRRVRIEVSNSSNDEGRRGGRMGMGRDNRRDGYDDPERTAGDWRSKQREEPSGGDERFRSRGGFDNRDRRDDREPSESDTKPGGWREGDRNNLAFSDRRGYRDDEKRGFKDEGDHRGGSAFGDRRGGFRDDGRRGGYRDDSEKDNEYSRDRTTSTWRSDAPSRVTNEDPPPQRERPKLNLQPRTKPIEPIVPSEESKEEGSEEPAQISAPAAPASAPAAKIFGAAKPVDTTAREREIEERLAKASADKTKTEEGESKGTWTRRNGEGRVDRDKEKPRPTWRSDEDRGRQVERRHDTRESFSGRSDNRGESRGNSRGPPNSRSGQGNYRSDNRSYDSRRPSERDRRSKDREDGARRERRSKDRDDGIPPMPKATDEKTPNFVASNKYTWLPEDVDTDNIDN